MHVVMREQAWFSVSGIVAFTCSLATARLQTGYRQTTGHGCCLARMSKYVNHIHNTISNPLDGRSLAGALAARSDGISPCE